jgi:carbon-monoxide dehydrogenase medium subunit
MRLPSFELHRPKELDEVFELLRILGDSARLMAGGTDLLPSLKRGKIDCRHVIALKGVAELDGVSFTEPEGLVIGATTLLAEVASFPATRERYPALASALHVLATPQVRNKATVAGNLCNASPCADTATPLMAHGAVAVIAGEQGRRELPVEELLTDPGRSAVGAGELVESIRVPTPAPELRSIFQKISPRSLVDIAAVNMTLALTMNEGVIDHVALFLGTVAPTPMRAAETEALLRGAKPSPELFEKAALCAKGECEPVTDFRATKEYKEQMVYVLTRRALETLTGAA